MRSVQGIQSIVSYNIIERNGGSTLKILDLVATLRELERKKQEIQTVLNELSFGEPSKILNRELGLCQNKIDAFLDTECTHMASLYRITADVTELEIDTGETKQIKVTGFYSDGTSKDVTKHSLPTALFRDFDKTSNVGFVTDVDVSGYVGESTSFDLIVTDKGIDVDSYEDTQGLQTEVVDVNKYDIVDSLGNSIGITFTTDGNQETGDNWQFDVYQIATGTTYELSDNINMSVTKDGLLSVEGGTENTLIIKNGSYELSIPITVVDTIAPDAPSITSVTLADGQQIVWFDPSTSPDAMEYTLYVDDVKHTEHIIYSELGIPLTLPVKDDVYKLELTCTDTSGNESDKTPPTMITITK